ncbi:MAG: tetratricopeptide repeat protein [Candidatus Magasanikbacteria bacterium]|nr:tetratricopeptide repeat protein [Candidatus Magasanikbacteria bacterium]
MLIFFLVLLVVGIVLVTFVVTRRLPQAANLDIENLPAEKEARKKREIILRRIEAEGARMKEIWKKRLAPIRKIWGFFQLEFRRYVGRVERLWHHEQRTKKKERPAPLPTAGPAVEKIDAIIADAEEQLKRGAFERAEELFISAIKLDQKSHAAYRGLADTYNAKGSLNEALETYEFLLRLDPENDAAMVKVADLYEAEGNLEKAIQYYQQAVVANDSLSPRFYHLAELLLKVNQPATAKEAILSAVELEPKNPKYLDLLTEVGIQCGDKDLAKQGFDELRLVNAKNQKLVDFQDRINNL